MTRFSHLDSEGRARMVDVGAKDETPRRAIASAFVAMAPETLHQLRERALAKGDALAVARVAGIQGAKLTSTLIPLCHPLPLDQASVTFVPVDEGADEDLPGIRILAETRTHGKTGVEMEALTAASVAGLALIDMIKGVDRAAHLRDVRLELKEGGKSGRWVREGFTEGAPEAEGPAS